jgi:hypothetical protein
MKYNWMSMYGDFEQEGELITFKGGISKADLIGRQYPTIGNYICDQKFGGGTIEAIVKFPEIAQDVSACRLILYYDSGTHYFVTAGIDIRNDSDYAFSVQHFDGKWTTHAITGQKSNIKPNEEYKLKVTLQGSSLELFVNQVSVSKVNLPFVLPRKQTGIWCQSSKDIVIKDFSVLEERAKAFVVMQFTTPYNELFSDVIKPICDKYNIDAIRADQTYGPGHILSDIMQQIYIAKFIIAEITPPNQNVFFEVGYAHAMRKPIIFIAEKTKELPFDVSGFRVLFYENSIRGKKKVEEGLSKHIEAILTEWSG